MFDFNEQFARGGAQFTVELFDKLNAAITKENIILSPFSIQTCLALAFAGAKGETAEEIAENLKYVSNNPTEVAETFQFVLEKYKNSDLLKIANKVYVQEGHEIKSDYATVTKEKFHAEAENINFGENVAAAQAINDWVESKTAGKITELIEADSLDENTRLVLLNALHFKGEWEKKFDESQTAEDDFFTGEEESVKLKYMNQKEKFGYGYFDEYNCTALEMPYKDSDLSMFVILPQERDGLKEVAKKLKDINLLDLAKQMSTEEVVIKFPKFKINFSLEMSEVLQKFGIKKAFGDEADFSNILESPEQLSISKVFHKACIEVNEEGSEAAAATGTIMMMRCAMLPLEFIADRPFFYWIWNKKNILFAGAFVTAPTEA